MSLKIKRILSVILFLVIGAAIVVWLTRVYSISNKYSEHAEMMIEGFYDAEEDSLDAVLIGSSRIYRFFQPAFAWEHFGIATTDFSTSDMPCGVLKNIGTEVLKTQSPKVIVFEISPYCNVEDEENNKIYLLLDNMKFSRNYFDMLRNFLKYHDVAEEDIWKYIFPLLQFHSRWSDTSEGDFIPLQESYLNSCYQKDFLKKATSDNRWKETEERRQVSENSEAALRDLLAWCAQQEGVEFLFSASPVLMGEGYQSKVNYVSDIVKEAGFAFVNWNKQDLFTSCGFDVTTDFQDIGHTNIKGSLKFTMAMSRYLMENYQLEDRSGEAIYQDWDQRVEAYHKIVDDYLYK